jgi:DNA replication licensing factor MCM4
MYLGSSNRPESAFIRTDDVKAYIRYARTLSPIISEEAMGDLISSYLSMRKVNGSSGKTIGATTRQLESLIRLSEAHAKAR